MYAFEQDVPINAAVYAEIMAGLGPEVPPGLLAHVAIEREDGHLHYLDLWESEQACNEFTESRLHPVVGAALQSAGIRVQGEPPRREVTVVDAWGSGFGTARRIATGSSSR
jgi:hypothetical protein